MNGGTLHDFFNKNSPLTEAHAAKLIYSLLKPIYYLHKLNIMHRDLKPENIIFRESTNFD
jgi:serine/threonine protein kinase